MIRLRHFAVALALAALALAPLTKQPAQAAFGQYLCAPDAPSRGQVARTVGGTNVSPSGTVYQLNAQGCAFIAQQDVGWLQSQGFSGGQNIFTVAVTALTATGTSASVTLPIGAYIHNIVLQETAGNAVTGGVDLGTAASGTQVASAVTLAGNGLVTLADTALLKRIFSTTASQGIFYTCHTNCNSSSVNMTVIYSLF